MVKTLTAPAKAQSLMRGIETRALVTIAFKDGTTLRVSDQSINTAPGGTSYLGLLTRLPEATGSVDDVARTNEPRELTLRVANTKTVRGYSRFSDLLVDHPIEFATVTVTWWLVGADATADLVTDFVGEAEEATSITESEVRVLVSGIEMSQRDPLPLYKINTTDFANAHESAVGRVVGPVIGTVKDVPLWPVDAGARTTLREYITSVSTGPLKLTDASDFPSSGTVIIGSEEIDYTGKSGNDLSTLTRGANNTTALFWDRGSLVVEQKSEYLFLGPTYPMKDYDEVKVGGVAVEEGEFTLDLKDTTTLPGYSVVSLRLNTPALMQAHGHETAEVTWEGKPQTVAAPAANGTGLGWANPNNAKDLGIDDLTTYAHGDRTRLGNLPAGVYAELQLSNWSTLPNTGEIVSATYHCNYQYEETNYISGKNDAYIDGIQIAQSAGITELTWGAPTSWPALNRTVICKIHPDTGFGLRIYDLWVKIIYVDPTVHKRAGSGFEALAQVAVTIDGDGVYDSDECTGLGDGDVTGTTGTLIERPDHVMEFVQRALAGRAEADLDIAGSYATSGSTYNTEGWVFAGALIREWGAGEILEQMAFEALSDQFWEAGVHTLRYDDPAPSVDVTITDRDLVGEVELSFTERAAIGNIIEAHFKRHYGAERSGERQQDFLGLATTEDASSQTSYGKRPASFELEFVRAQAHADDVAARLLDKLKGPRWVARIPLAWTKAAALERGDILDLNIDLFSTLGARPKMKATGIERSFQEESFVIEAVEVK